MFGSKKVVLLLMLEFVHVLALRVVGVWFSRSSCDCVLVEVCGSVVGSEWSSDVVVR